MRSEWKQTAGDNVHERKIIENCKYCGRIIIYKVVFRSTQKQGQSHGTPKETRQSTNNSKKNPTHRRIEMIAGMLTQ